MVPTLAMWKIDPTKRMGQLPRRDNYLLKWDVQSSKRRDPIRDLEEFLKIDPVNDLLGPAEPVNALANLLEIVL